MISGFGQESYLGLKAIYRNYSEPRTNITCTWTLLETDHVLGAASLAPSTRPTSIGVSSCARLGCVTGAQLHSSVAVPWRGCWTTQTQVFLERDQAPFWKTLIFSKEAAVRSDWGWRRDSLNPSCSNLYVRYLSSYRSRNEGFSSTMVSSLTQTGFPSLALANVYSYRDKIN